MDNLGTKETCATNERGVYVFFTVTICQQGISKTSVHLHNVPFQTVTIQASPVILTALTSRATKTSQNKVMLLFHACTSHTTAALTETLAPSSVCWLPSPYITAPGGGRWGGVQD